MRGVVFDIFCSDDSTQRVRRRRFAASFSHRQQLVVDDGRLLDPLRSASSSLPSTASSEYHGFILRDDVGDVWRRFSAIQMLRGTSGLL